MNESKFKTLRHIEAVRNFINVVISELLKKQEQHDQSKLEPPEVDIFDKYTPKLKNCTYGSEEYKQNMKGMKVAIDHHNGCNRHHPEHHTLGIQDMNLIDLIEMICDWKAASLRHADGDIMKSLAINMDRFGYSEDLYQVFANTVRFIEKAKVYHKADES